MAINFRENRLWYIWLYICGVINSVRGFSKSIKEIAKGAIIVVVSVAFIYTTSCCGACSLPPKVSENISAWETGEYKGLYAAQRLELFAVRQEDVGRYEKVNFYISEGKSFFEY